MIHSSHGLPILSSATFVATVSTVAGLGGARGYCDGPVAAAAGATAAVVALFDCPRAVAAVPCYTAAASGGVVVVGGGGGGGGGGSAVSRALVRGGAAAVSECDVDFVAIFVADRSCKVNLDGADGRIGSLNRSASQLCRDPPRRGQFVQP